jgi:hypothetical protein
MSQPSTNPIFHSPDHWPLIGEWDVAVMGAGPAGLGAACGAAQLGARVVIIDRAGAPGGVATNCCCPYLMGFAYNGRQIIGGVADRLVRQLDALGQAAFKRYPENVADPTPLGDRPLLDNVVTSIEGVRLAAYRLLAAAGVTPLMYTNLLGAVTEGERVLAAAVDRAQGPGLIKARAFVDATGDAELVARAGGQVRTYPPERTMTKTILIKVGGVVNFNRAIVEEAFAAKVAAGTVPLPAQDRFMGYGVLNPGEVQLNFTLTAGDGLSSEDLTRMDHELREQAWPAVEWFRQEIPGFAEAYLLDAAARVGVRAGRGIVGRETITRQDLDEGTPVAEPVALGTRSYGGHGLQSFLPPWRQENPGLRAIPRGALEAASFTNVTAGGRGLSCEVEVLDSFRLMARCLATGQAAGVLAALASQAGGEVALVPYDRLAAALIQQGAIIS